MPGRQGRGGRGGGRGGNMPREVQVSKKLSWLLRHGAEKEGLKLGAGGYINLQEVLNNRNIRSLKVSLSELKELVADNDKQRFSLIPISEAPDAEKPEDGPSIPSDLPTDGDDASQWLIRANQGHSIKVDEEGLMKPITLDSELPAVVVHGTTEPAWPKILASGGLKKMTRNHVHFAIGLPSGFQPLDATEDAGVEVKKEPVISGMRSSSAVLIYLDLRKALEGGLKFWRSANGVVLTEGDEKGVVGIEYFRRVEERKRGLGVIMRDGVEVKSA